MDKRLAFGITFLAVMGNLPAQNRDVRTYMVYQELSTDLLEKFEYYYDSWSQQMIKHGKYSRWSKKGILILETTYKDGQLHGRQSSYDKRGRLNEQQQWVAGIQEGETKIFGKKGKIKETQAFVSGQMQGKHILYGEDGQKEMECDYRGGEKSGACIWYGKDGNVKRTKLFGSARKQVEKAKDTRGVNRKDKQKAKDKKDRKKPRE